MSIETAVMPKSEFEYAEVHGHAQSIGPIVQVWSEQGWDVVTVGYGEHCSSALLRRPRREGAPDGPGTRLMLADHLSGTVVVENCDSGTWKASRFCACGGNHRVASVYGHNSKEEAIAALDRIRADAEVVELWESDRREDAFALLRSRRLNLSCCAMEWLMHEFDYSFVPKFGLR